MKKVYKNKITNIESTDLFDNKFLFDYLKINYLDQNIKIIFLADLLEKRKNNNLFDQIKQKPAMFSNVYPSEVELEIFKNLFEEAIEKGEKIHIVGVTLRQEIEILEDYYTKLGFFNEIINCFSVDFTKPLVTISVNIENLIWKGSDYKAMREKIFFNPPVRESGENKAMFKGINRGVIAGVNISILNDNIQKFLGDCIRQEKILPITLAKVLSYNLEEIGFLGEKNNLIIEY